MHKQTYAHISYRHKCIHIHSSTDIYIYTHTYKHNYTLSHIYILTYANIHAHSQANTYAQLLFTNTHTLITPMYTYVHVNKYIHIPVHTYRDI